MSENVLNDVINEINELYHDVEELNEFVYHTTNIDNNDNYLTNEEK